MSSIDTVILCRSLALAMGMAPAILGTATATAADRGVRSDAQSVYQADRAACNAGQTNQDRATCLREAGAALQEARRGQLEDGQAQFDRNKMLRCDLQPQEDRQACVRRMNGEGFTSGSVEGGGIYRELVVPVIPSPNN
jgi:hypothetical protein